MIEINFLEEKLFLLCKEIEIEEKRLETFLCFKNTSKSYHNNNSKILDINDKTVINDYCYSKGKNVKKIVNIPELQLNVKPSHVYTPYVLQNFLLHFFSWYDFDNFQFLDSSDNNDERQRIVCTDNGTICTNDLNNLNNGGHENKNNFEENCTYIKNYDSNTDQNYNNNSEKNDEENDIDRNCDVSSNSTKTRKTRKIFTYVDENLKNLKSPEKNKNSQFSLQNFPKSPYQRILNYFK